MKRYGLIGYILSSLIEIGLLAGAYAVDYFTKKKMGMVRFINYHTLKLEKAYPMAQIVMAVVAILILLAIVTVFLYGKRRNSLKTAVVPVVTITVLLTAGITLFAILTNKAVTRAYYFIFAMISLAALIQSIKCFVCILHNKQ